MKDYDAYIDGVRLSGGWQTEPPIDYENAGIPGIHMCMDTMLPQAKFSMLSWGLPAVRIVAIPALKWIAAENKPENYPAIAEYMLDEVIDALDILNEGKKGKSN